MAVIRFFATDQDREALWDFILSEMRLKAVPDPWFGSPPVQALAAPADIAGNVKGYPRVAPGLSYFLISSDWSYEPLVHHLFENHPIFPPHWYTDQRYGGPSIHFVPSWGYPRHMKRDRIVSGQFSDYPFYYSGV